MKSAQGDVSAQIGAGAPVNLSKNIEVGAQETSTFTPAQEKTIQDNMAANPNKSRDEVISALQTRRII